MRRASLLFLLFIAPFLCRASDNSAVLDEINLARTRPWDYAAIVQARMQSIPDADERCFAEAAAFLRRQRPLDPLQWMPGLETSARRHVEDIGAAGGRSHRGTDGSTPWSRMAGTGQWTGRKGENISYGYADPRTIVVTLIVDQGVPDRGHRRLIFSPDFKVAGAARGPHARFGAMCVIDFAGGFAEKGEKVAMTDPWSVPGGW